MTFTNYPPRVRRVPGPRRSGPCRAAAWAAAAALLLSACDGGTRVSVVSQGVERRATVDRPAARPAAGPRPLLVVLHGGLLSGASTRGELEPLPAMARRAGVALAFPDA